MKYRYTLLLIFMGLIGFATHSSAQTYCQSAAQNSFDSDITRVVVNTLDVNSENFPCSQYSHYTSKTTSLDIGSTYSMSITLGVHSGCGGDFYDKSARAWIDFNGDGDFDDAGELLGATQYTFGTFTSSFSFTVPCAATAGVKRMRVVCQEANPNNITPCNTYFYGETEDYNVTLVAGPAASADFSIPDTVYTDWVAQFININQSGYTHEWYNSDDDVTLSTLGSTNTNYSHVFTSPGCYDVKLVSTNCQGTAITTKQVCVVDPTSLPVPNFVVSTNIYYFTGNPIEIQFHDLSQYGPNSWEWSVSPDFSTGASWFWSTGNQYSQNPTAFFYDTGTYEICLLVSNSLGVSAPICKQAYIRITPPTGLNSVNLMGSDFKGLLDSGYIYDSGGETGDYSSNEYNQFTIEPCGASSITLHFQEFNLESGNDVLKIYDGPNSLSPQIGSYSGNTIPANVTASSGVMTLEFQSSAGTNLSGFKAYWTSVIPANGQASADFILPDTLYECASGTDITVLNASTGVVPGQAEYEWIMDYDANVTYPSGYCEVCDETNADWTYTATGSVQDHFIRLVMKTCEGNDTVVKKVVVMPTTNLPAIDFIASNRRVSAGSTVVLTEVSTANCSRQWDIMPATGWSVAPGYSLTDPVVAIVFNNAGSYHITLNGSNGNGNAQEVKTNFIDVIDYCSPSVSISGISDVGITRVRINTIDNNTSSGQAPGYTNYSQTTSTTLKAGQTYSITVKRKLPIVNAMNRKAWIDFNRDGVFDEPDERVLYEASAMTDSFMASFTVPDYTVMVAGPSRLRVGVALDNTSNTPCGPVGVGEFEDYAINLVHDDIPPVLTLLGIDSVRIEKNSTYNEVGVLALDNIEGNISHRVVRTGFIDSSQSGHYILTYNVKDASGISAVPIQRHVFVLNDITAPSISLLGNNPLIHSVYTPFVEPGYSAIDNPGNVSVPANLIQVSNNLDVNKLGDYTVKYKVTDSYGNSSEVIRDVLVRDLDAPIISSAANVFWQVGVPFIDPVQLTDNYDQSVLLRQSGFMNVNLFGTYTVTFDATDASGNMAIPVTVQFTVGDSVRPTFKTQAHSEDIYVKVNDVFFKEPKVEAQDNYYPSVQLERDASQVNIFVIGVYPITYTATDGAGNTAVFTRRIHVYDDEAPVVSALPMNINRWSSYDPMKDILVKDNYNVPSWFEQNNKIQVVLNNVDANTPGVYQIVYRATDESGNISSLATRYVSVSEVGANGIENADLSSDIQVYPNPSSTGVFKIDLKGQLQNSDIFLRVLDVSGAQIADVRKLVNPSNVVDISSLAKGVYMLQIEVDSKMVIKKIIIQ